MGSVLNNLDNLVQQPTGCGEQNMVRFAPIISVTKYLKETNQLTSKMDDLTKNYLTIGLILKFLNLKIFKSLEKLNSKRLSASIKIQTRRWIL